MTCPDCYGTGHERPYEPWEDCPTCDGSGVVDGGEESGFDYRGPDSNDQMSGESWGEETTG